MVLLLHLWYNALTDGIDFTIQKLEAPNVAISGELLAIQVNIEAVVIGVAGLDQSSFNAGYKLEFTLQSESGDIGKICT